jgi:hypothetical protein
MIWPSLFQTPRRFCWGVLEPRTEEGAVMRVSGPAWSWSSPMAMVRAMRALLLAMAWCMKWRLFLLSEEARLSMPRVIMTRSDMMEIEAMRANPRR